MPRKKANEAAIAPPPVSEASVPVIKKTRKAAVATSDAVKPARTVAPRKKPAPKVAAEAVNESIVNLAEAVAVPVALDAREIEERAYQSWIERGCPMGSPEEDWYRAERELTAMVAAAGR